jgi:hypothetical protein
MQAPEFKPQYHQKKIFKSVSYVKSLPQKLDKVVHQQMVFVLL